jgi:hypothetical protein
MRSSLAVVNRFFIVFESFFTSSILRLDHYHLLPSPRPVTIVSRQKKKKKVNSSEDFASLVFISKLPRFSTTKRTTSNESTEQ